MTELVVELLQPATFGERTAGSNVISTVAFAPGAAVRGAVAAAWIRSFGAPQSSSTKRRAEFEALFERASLWGPLTVDGTSVEPTYVGRCKYPKDTDCAATLVDLSVGETDDKCRSCEDTLEWGKGQVKNSETVRASSTQLDEAETAATGRLFSRDYLPKGSVLRGFVGASADDLDWLEGSLIWLGARSSVAGMARVLELTDAPSAPVEIVDHRVVARAVSPLIICDDFGRPDPFRATRALADALGLSPTQYSPIPRSADWLRIVRTSGWNGVGGCPKPDEWAVAPGAAVGILLDPTCDQASIERSADRVQREGLGARRSEGFGCVVINPPKWSSPVATRPNTSPARSGLEVPDFNRAQHDQIEPLIRRRIEQLEATPDASPDPVGRLERNLSEAQKGWLQRTLSSKDLGWLRQVWNRIKGFETDGGTR